MYHMSHLSTAKASGMAGFVFVCLLEPGLCDINPFGTLLDSVSLLAALAKSADSGLWNGIFEFRNL